MEFLRYVKEVHARESNENIVYYMLDLQSCDPCINANLGLLETIEMNDKLVPVMIGNPRYGIWDSQIEKIISRFTTLEDEKSEAHFFELGMSKPLIIVVREGIVKDYMSVSDFEIDKAKPSWKDTYKYSPDVL